MASHSHHQDKSSCHLSDVLCGRVSDFCHKASSLPLEIFEFLNLLDFRIIEICGFLNY